jgi:putative chitinase
MIEKLSSVLQPIVMDELQSVIDKFSIDNPLRLAHFLAQASHESGGFQVIRENLNYSKDGLVTIFPKYFNGETAIKYEKKPEQIANIIYASRMGNGNKESGDGWKFRGRGYIQLTGKDNYTLFNGFVDDDILTDPDLVASVYPLLSAGWFWNKSSLNSIADIGDSVDVVTRITRRINGGTNGLQDRIKQFDKFYKLLTNG